MPSGRGQPPLADPAAAFESSLRAEAGGLKALQQLRSGESVGNLQGISRPTHLKSGPMRLKIDLSNRALSLWCWRGIFLLADSYGSDHTRK